MDTTIDHKTAQAQAAIHQRYLELHRERAVTAEWSLRQVEHRAMDFGELSEPELIDACVRMLIDLSLKKRPAMDLAALFLRYTLLVPLHMRVPFVNAVASCCQPTLASLPETARPALRKKLHTLANKVGAVLYELNMEFADWHLTDPAQVEMFTPPPVKPAQVLDDGGEVVNMETGEVG